MTAPARALVIGEVLVDIVRRADAVSEHPGGSPANVAIGLGRLGRPVELLTWFGQDDRGRLVAEHLAASGVTVAPGSESAPRTSVAIATLDATGAAEYTFDLTWQVPPTTRMPDCPVTVVHTGSVAAVLDPGGADVRRIVTATRTAATVTYDPNIRPALMPDVRRTRPIIEEMVGLADVVKVSIEDLAWLDADPIALARAWTHAGPALVVVTRGGAGATAFTASGEVSVAAPPVTVADTVGAGDAFMAGLIDGLWSAGLLGGAQRSALQAIGEETVRTVLERCATIAAITVSRPGADPPRRGELGLD